MQKKVKFRGFFSATFSREYEKEEHTPTQVKQLIESHLKEKEVIESSLPANIVIGPFWITCDGVRQALAKKKKALANSVLELLAKKLRKQADEVINVFLPCSLDE